MPVSGEDWGVKGDSVKQAELLSSCVEEQGVSAEDFRMFAGCGGKGDLAYNGMIAMLDAMKEQDRSFHYTEDFLAGNFYYASWSSGGHDVKTVCTVLYNGLPQFFEKESGYLKNWAGNILAEKLPEKICKKSNYFDYGKWVTKTYYSKTAGRETKVNVLLPAYYDKNRAYPVLYLLHGYYDDESWMKNTTRLLYLGRASEDQAVGDTPAQIHDILERNSVEHIWQLFDGVGHDKNSVEVYLYNYLRMIFK